MTAMMNRTLALVPTPPSPRAACPQTLEAQIVLMATARPSGKLQRYQAVELLVGLATAPPIGSAHGEDFELQHVQNVRRVLRAWTACKALVRGAPTSFPRDPVFQNFAIALHEGAQEALPRELAFAFAAWLEEKFSAGKHSCWSLFLESALLQPLGIPAQVLPEILLPLEAMLHVFDDYIDSQSSLPHHDLMDIGLGLSVLSILPLLAAKVAGVGRAATAWSALAEAIAQILRVPQIENDTREELQAAYPDLEAEVEVAAFNIDARTRATTSVFLAPLAAMLPENAAELERAWETLWLVRAAEMCMKDAVFDIEADQLNCDHTPASVWADRLGVTTPQWHARIEALFSRYMNLWESQVRLHAELPAAFVSSAEARFHRNRFLLQSLRPSALGDFALHDLPLHDLPLHDLARRGLPVGLRGTKKVFMVAAGKGGVGKSTVSWLLATSLRNRGNRVGVIDADIWGPSQNLLFQRSTSVSFEGETVVPLEIDGITVVSLGQFVGSKDALLLRSSMAANLLTQFAREVQWPAVDYLVIDLPPGASDVHIQLCELFPEAEILLVTLEQELALADTSRALTVYEMLNKRVCGMVLNMTTMACCDCGFVNTLGAKIDDWAALPLSRIPVLARIPFDARLTNHAALSPDEDPVGDVIDALTTRGVA